MHGKSVKKYKEYVIDTISLSSKLGNIVTYHIHPIECARCLANKISWGEGN